MSTFSAKRPMTVIVAIILIVTLGVISFTKMQSTLLPKFELPYVVAFTTYPGAEAEKVELAVTKPLESAMSTAGGLESMTSVSSENLSLIIMQFAYSTNMDSALIELNGQIDLVRGYLDDAVSSPTLMQIDPDMMPVIVAAVSVSGLDKIAASDYIRDTVVPRVERVDGVATVNTQGLVSSAVEVSFDDVKLDALQAKFDKAVDEGFADGRQELADAESELDENEKKLEDSRAELADGRKKAESEFASKEKELRDAEKKLTSGIEELEQAIAAIDAGYAPADSRAELAAQLAALEGQKEQLEAGKAQLATAKKQTLAKLDNAEEELNTATEQLDAAREEVNSGRDKLDEAYSDALAAVNVRDMITESMLAGLIQAGNLSLPAGYVIENGERFSVKVGDELASASDIENLLLFENDDVGEVYVRDVATVAVTDDSDASFAKINGENGILLMVNKQSSASTTDVSRDVRACFDELCANGDGVSASILSDQGVYIDIVVETVINNLLMGAVLAIAILILFLRSAKPTLIVALSIPTSLLLAMTLMYFFDISLNLISLCGLAMGVGMLVDNSIVVMENIYRLRAEGMSAIKAAVMGAKEVGGAIAASTLTTICVFLPIVFTDGLSRELFTDMGLTIAFSLIASLLVAYTAVPALSSMMLTSGAKKETKLFSRLLAAYEKALSFTLSHKAIAIVLVTALLGLSVYGALTSGTAFIPESDSLQLIASVTVPEDTKTADARALMDGYAEDIRALEGVDSVGVMEGSAIGSAFSGAASSSDGGSYTLYAVLAENRTKKSAALADELTALCVARGLEISVMSGSTDVTSLMSSGVSIDIYGENIDTLRSTAREIAALIADIPGVASVEDGIGDTSKLFAVSVDKLEAMRYGLTTAQVYSAVSDALKTENAAGSVSLGATEADIVINAAESAVLSPSTLGSLELVGTRDGEKVKLPLSDVAEISEGESQLSIRRSNNTRTLSVTASIDSAHNIKDVSAAIEAALASYEVPVGFRIELSGENETINDALSDLISMSLLALLLIYLIMVAQFQNLLSPFIVMFTIPLAFTGGLLLQWACGFEVSVISMLGLLVLFGVVVNNGIVFVDCANGIYQETGDRRASLIAAGRRRMRPILMTALTTILALVTMCFGIGTGADMIQPMAVVLVGGLAYGTVLTLFIVPVFYDILRRKPPRKVDVEA